MTDYVSEDRGYETPCWIALLTPASNGYVHLRRPRTTGDNGLMHRIYYERYVGPIPEGLDLDHLCRQRNCVNPDHLEPVTRAENLRRGAKSKFTEEQVRYIRSCDVGTNELARRFGVCSSTVSRIRTGKLWRGLAA